MLDDVDLVQLVLDASLEPRASVSGMRGLCGGQRVVEALAAATFPEVVACS